jgi:hypothetical protein
MPGTKGNTNSQTHGAAAGERALSTGVDFSGLAAVTEQAVRAEMETDGISSIVKRDAIRLQVVADLYYAAILGAGSLEQLDSLVKRYGWIAASTLRAWAQLEQAQKAVDRVGVVDVLDAVKGANDDSENKDS